MKFGQGVYWGDDGWRAQIMGLVGGKRVAGLGGLGESVSGGRLTAGDGKVAGRACPAPTGWRKGERVLAGRVRGCGVVSGHLCRGRRPRRHAEGSRPLPTVWGETGCVKQ